MASTSRVALFKRRLFWVAIITFRFSVRLVLALAGHHSGSDYIHMYITCFDTLFLNLTYSGGPNTYSKCLDISEQPYRLLNHSTALEGHTLEGPRDKRHGPFNVFRTDVGQVIELTGPRVTDLHLMVSMVCFPPSYNTIDRLTGSPFAQICSTFAFRPLGNLSPTTPSLKFGSPNMTTDLILGNREVGSLSAARCMMLAPCE